MGGRGQKSAHGRENTPIYRNIFRLKAYKGSSSSFTVIDVRGRSLFMKITNFLVKSGLYDIFSISCEFYLILLICLILLGVSN